MRKACPPFYRTGLLVATVLIGLVASNGQQAQRGVLPTPEPESVALAPPGPFYALIIGNNNYQYLGKLQTAVNDATAVAQLFRDQYGFQTKLLTNATRAEILTALASYRRELGEDSSLVVYFAGHGYDDREAGEAYWLPVDAQRDNNDNWISADDITRSARAIAARHVLIISDSCYSGGLARNADWDIDLGGGRTFLTKMLQAKSRTLMSSGGDEPVEDSGAQGHSVFAWALLQGMQAMEEDEFTADDLFHRKIWQRVGGQSKQVPEYKTIRDSGHVSGDFVFFRSKRVTAMPVSKATDQPHNAKSSIPEEPLAPTAASSEVALAGPSHRPDTSQITSTGRAPGTASSQISQLPHVDSRFRIDGPAQAETVLDAKTGLMWMRNDYVNLEKTFATNWNDAMEWAKKINAAGYGGYTDWAVPTIAQYRTINSSKSDRGEYLRVFQRTSATDFWASDTPSKYVASYISFTEGYAVSGAKTDPSGWKELGRGTFPISVRLVRETHGK